jgi:methoxymalonate biosynthesis acyl carrier protein
MNEPNNVKEIIRSFINDSVNIDALDDEENLFESGLINSLFAVQLTTFLERKFGIEIGQDDLDIENLKSVNAATAFVGRKSAGVPGATSAPAEEQRAS